jgi:hypothetical protein
MRRVTFLAILFWAFAATSGAGRVLAMDIDTEHMFGFTEGSDIGKRGETEAEFETIGRFGRNAGSYSFGRNAGSYSAVTTSTELKYAPSDYFRISGAVAVTRFDIAALDGSDDQHRFTVSQFSTEMRFHILDRATQPIGLTFIATPFVGFIDPSNGALGDRFGASFIIAADRALVRNDLYAALNLGYSLERDRPYSSGINADSSTLLFNAALVKRLNAWLYLGGEARYLRGYDGFGLYALAGQAAYLGPVFYLPLARGFSISGAWDIQAWGQATGLGGPLDLTNFERHQAKLRVSINL